MTDAREIAAGLSEAQKNLLHLAATNDHVNTYDNSLYRGAILRCLAPIDVGRKDAAASFRITPLGLAVRAVLMEGDGA